MDESDHPKNSIKFILYINGVSIVNIDESDIGSGYSTSAITSEISVTKGQSVTWDFSTDGYINVGHCDVFLIS